MFQGCVVTLVQGHISKVKVRVHRYQTSVPWQYKLTARLDLHTGSTIHNCCPMTQGCVMTLTQCHISKVNVIVHTYPKSVKFSGIFHRNIKQHGTAINFLSFKVLKWEFTYYFSPLPQFSLTSVKFRKNVVFNRFRKKWKACWGKNYQP